MISNHRFVFLNNFSLELESILQQLYFLIHHIEVIVGVGLCKKVDFGFELSIETASENLEHGNAPWLLVVSELKHVLDDKSLVASVLVHDYLIVLVEVLLEMLDVLLILILRIKKQFVTSCSVHFNNFIIDGINFFLLVLLNFFILEDFVEKYVIIDEAKNPCKKAYNG